MTAADWSGPLQAHCLRELDLRAPPSPGRAPFLSAASGLVRSGGVLHVVADDELHLGCFEEGSLQPGTLLRLFDGTLPDAHHARKQHKPDLEILLALPSTSSHEQGALLAMGSGSRATRHRCALLPLDLHGHVTGQVIEVDGSPLHARLSREFDDLNLEGAWCDEERFCLLQRGHGGQSPSALIALDRAAIEQALVRDRELPALDPQAIFHMDLGSRQGVPLSFTDACGLRDGHWLFSAVAEDTRDARADGAFIGTVLGVAARDGRVLWQRAVEPAFKIEGIAARPVGDSLEVLCVSDADDARHAAKLLRVTI